MTIMGFKPRNHPQQIARHGRADDTIDDRRTPADVWRLLHAEFQFTLDAAASDQNAKLPKYCTLTTSGLTQSWAGERVWCNPPFSNCAAWVTKAWDAMRGGGRAGCHAAPRESHGAALVAGSRRAVPRHWQGLGWRDADRAVSLRTPPVRSARLAAAGEGQSSAVRVLPVDLEGGMTRPVTWRPKQSLRSGELGAWWARLNGWTLDVRQARVDQQFRVSLHRFNGGTADMPACPRLFTTLRAAQRAAETYATTGDWS